MGNPSNPLIGRPDMGHGVTGRFTGDLSRFSTLDLAQMLMLARKTGLLTLKRGERRGYFFFRNGEIVSVMDDGHRQGMQAALHLFLWKDGTFEFDFDKVPPEGTLGVPTENLLMEAARHIDEAARDDADPLEDAAGPPSRSLVDTQLDSIREIFARIVDRALPQAARARRGKGIDGLIARMAPRLVCADRVVALDAAPVASADVERLILASLDPSGRRRLERHGIADGMLETSTGTALRAMATIHGGTRTLSLHMLRTVPELPEQNSDLRNLLDATEGCFLVFGEPLAAALGFAAAATQALSESRNAPAVWLCRRASYRFSIEQGFVVSQPAGGTLHSAKRRLRGALERGSRIVALADVPAAWIAELAPRALDRAALVLAVLEPDPTLAIDPTSLLLPPPHETAHRGAFEVAPGDSSTPLLVLFHAARTA
jgi:hypothetical protein